MNLKDLEDELKDDEEFVDDDDTELQEDLTTALDLLQTCMIAIGRIVIKVKTGEVIRSPHILPDLLQELEEFLDQWTDYGQKADDRDEYGRPHPKSESDQAVLDMLNDQ